MPKQEKLKEYDEEPVVFCAKCYSLKIKHDEDIDLDCCEECGSTDFKTADIYTWEKLFKGRYKHKYIDIKHNIKKSPIFMLSIDKLKSMLYKDDFLTELCKTMYSNFPGGLSRADTVILLFDKLIKDNRLDELRIELINQNYKNKK